MTATARPDIVAQLDAILDQIDDATADTVLSLLREVRDSGGGGGGGTVGGATEVTLAKVLAQLDDATADTVLSVLKEIEADTDLLEAVRDRLPTSGAASEAKLEAVRALLAGGLSVTVSNPTDVSALARETTLEAVRVLLANEDFASEAKLEAVRALLASGIGVTVSNPTDVSALARETTLESVRVLLANEDFASEAKLEAVRALLAGGLSVTVSNPTDVTALAREATVARKFGSGKITRAVQVNALGNTPVVTPTAGRRLRLFWVGMSTSENNGGEVLVLIRFGATTHYRWRMGSPGAFSHWEVIEGAVDEPLTVNLDQPLPVEFNYTYEEFG